MDIHRCRFVPHQPASISALAFSHTSDLTQKAPPELRLALGRENSDIEIWNPSGGRWLRETVLRGSVGATVEQLAWTQDLTIEDEGADTIAKPGAMRLFSIGGSSSISEWSLASGKQLRRAEGNFGDIWCFAAQPAYQLPENGKVEGPIPSQSLVAGCGNGSIVLFATDDGDLRYSQVLHAPQSKKSKVLSITWRDRNTVVAGYEDSLIRVFDVSTRKVIRQMSLGKPAEGSKTVVWTVKCLPDGTIVSGDSSGELKIWDAKNLSLTQRLKSHQADILDITASSKGDQIFTFGVDRRTIAYQPLPNPSGQKKRRWAQVMHRRFHDHDVKCAASYESRGLSVLVSGGMDASPIVLPMRNWQSEYHRSLSHLPQQPQMSTSRNRLMLAWWGRELNVFHLPRRSTDGEITTGSEDYELLATLQLKGEENIQSAQISGDGSLVISATPRGVRLFQLRRTSSNGGLAMRSRSVPLPLSLHDYGARHVTFSPDGKWLCVARFDNTILLAKIIPGAEPKDLPSIHPTIARLEPTGDDNDDSPLRAYADAISAITFSPESRVLAVGTLSGHTTAWTLEGHEDRNSLSPKSVAKNAASDSDSDSDSSDSDTEDDSPLIHAQRWTRTPTLPRLDASILLLLFRPSSPASSSPTAIKDRHHLSPPSSNIALHPTRHTPNPVAHEHPTLAPLVAITSSHTLTELDITRGKLTPWSRRNPSSLLPPHFRRIKDRVMGGFFHHQRLWLYGPNWLYMLDLSRDFPAPTPSSSTGPVPNQLDGAAEIARPGKKRKRPTKDLRGTGAGDKITKRRDRDTPFAATALRYKGDEGAMELVDLDRRMEPGSDAEDDEADDQLLALRRGEEGLSLPPPPASPDGSKSKSANADSPGGDGGGWRAPREGEAPRDWFTFRYRSIFGVGVLRNDGVEAAMRDEEVEVGGEGKDVDVDVGMNMNGTGDTQEKVGGHVGSNGLEVVIVERPMYEVGQPERFEGGQDWDA
ncbi:uncharacterized protein HMPREF1541_06453 [Cyphellophora europaea CBS 101466]|uniref:Uncharacterized protein n=1 Tax=Cyphellophora europaea (strain CBS 101466) TaxID=1220924 RepID=W2RRS1_CYPE1|nr:uncharacterized protein HMPREF1541_06453 [Cyphellophora europaea CBS 101466]ETN38418.1 hypothetical protein HMPREF1541_06453 [Cyphellophora europaea CBS 101466]